MVDNSNNSLISKRNFLKSVGIVGGSSAVFTAMQGLNMVHASSMSTPPKLNTVGKGKTVIILGAGIAGMVSALELTNKGYECKIIEARDFTGGRCQTARKGTVIEEVAGETQVCNFTDDQYFNVGPWRIPAEHKATLHYCNSLGVKLEPFINYSPQAYYYSEKMEGAFKGGPIKQIEAQVDRAGHVSELLAKCVDTGKLDDQFNEEDKEMLLEYLRTTGLIDKKELNYRANKARGYADYPGNGPDKGVLSEPYPLKEILKMNVGALYDMADHPAVMFQAVGGMDNIAKAMEKNLPRGSITFNSEIKKVLQNGEGIEITYVSTKNGKEKTIMGDYCISTIPLPILSKTENNIETSLLEALKSASGKPAVKLGLQMNYRFWEKEEMIYGGITRTDDMSIREIAYPSSELHSNKGGVLLGSFTTAGDAIKLSNLSVAERVENCLAAGEKIHPSKYRKYYTGNVISKAWHKDKYALGAVSIFSSRTRMKSVTTLLKGDRRLFIAGDASFSLEGAWMSGAIESAWYTIAELDKRAANS